MRNIACLLFITAFLLGCNDNTKAEKEYSAEPASTNPFVHQDPSFHGTHSGGASDSDDDNKCSDANLYYYRANQKYHTYKSNGDAARVTADFARSQGDMSSYNEYRRIMYHNQDLANGERTYIGYLARGCEPTEQ